MNEMKPLDIVDDRTIEQIREDGDDRWPDGTPYIKDGVCSICERPAGQNHTCLINLETPGPCGMHELMQEPQRCTGLAYWAGGVVLTDMCDECIVNMLEKLPDNRDWLQPALADIRERHLHAGARVRIQMGDETGNLGTVYNHLPGRPAPWHVRPDGWPADEPGIAYKAEELDVLL